MHEKTLSELSRGLAAGEFSSRELTDAFLARIEKYNGPINAFVTVTAESARQAAEAADASRAKGAAGSLTGIPIAQKDIFCTQGVRTSCGSKML
ncbi:MAG TPA: amidase family protein, partial [Methylococcaceae bacterium]|nr:amidase family protein [Methylococcaceae bacterium]